MAVAVNFERRFCMVWSGQVRSGPEGQVTRVRSSRRVRLLAKGDLQAIASGPASDQEGPRGAAEFEKARDGTLADPGSLRRPPRPGGFRGLAALALAIQLATGEPGREIPIMMIE